VREGSSCLPPPLLLLLTATVIEKIIMMLVESAELAMMSGDHIIRKTLLQCLMDW